MIFVDRVLNIENTGCQNRNWKEECSRFLLWFCNPAPPPPHPFPSIRSFEIYGQWLIPVEYRWIIQKYFLIWLVTTKIDLIMAGYLPTYTIHHTWWRQCLLSLTSNIINWIRCYVKEVLIKVYWAGFRQMHNKRGIFEDY